MAKAPEREPSPNTWLQAGCPADLHQQEDSTMNTYFDVKETVRSLVGDDDPNGWLKEGYLGPKVNLAYRMMTLYLKRATGANLEKMVEIPNKLDANGNNTNQGLTSLAVHQQKGGLLEGLYEPLFLWFKPAGASELWYREIGEKKTILPGQSVPGGGGQPITSTWWGGNSKFAWRGNQLFVTPFGMPVDFLVDGRFNPPALVKDEDYLVVDPDMEICTTLQTMPLIGTESGNQGYLDIDPKAAACADDIVAKIVRGKQGVTARAGSNGRLARGCGWSWW